MFGASAAKRATIARQASASRHDTAAIRSAVSSTSLLTPSHVPSGKAVAKLSGAGTKARPCRSRPSLWAAKNGEPANRLRFIA